MSRHPFGIALLLLAATAALALPAQAGSDPPGSGGYAGPAYGASPALPQSSGYGTPGARSGGQGYGYGASSALPQSSGYGDANPRPGGQGYGYGSADTPSRSKGDDTAGARQGGQGYGYGDFATLPAPSGGNGAGSPPGSRRGQDAQGYGYAPLGGDIRQGDADASGQDRRFGGNGSAGTHSGGERRRYQPWTATRNPHDLSRRPRR